ncbi:MAG TPA: hypothetical protein VJ729_01725 [Nitrososphaeraceae archaeon]|nr:hypothetical protein [Nitrososphaeraceae archaeon]
MSRTNNNNVIPIISPWLEQNRFLPTQKNLGSGPGSIHLNQTIPHYKKMMSMIPTGHSTPSISEYPQIADNMMEAIEDVYYGIKQPQQALNYGAAKSAKALGWYVDNTVVLGTTVF